MLDVGTLNFIGNDLCHFGMLWGQFSNPLFSIFLISTIILHGSAGTAHAPTVKVQNNVR